MCPHVGMNLSLYGERSKQRGNVWMMDHYLSQVNPVQVFCCLKLDSSSMVRSVEHFSEKSIPFSQ